jgi:electron transport complex protein RnfD
MLKDITVSPSPHISKSMSTRSVMVDVVIGLVPAMVMAGIYFRVRAFILIPVCVVSCVVAELLCNLIRKKANPTESIGDFSAVVTGIILALSLPPALPVWAAVIGSGFSIVIGKMVFGGLGANTFNPAMVGRTFLTASFGMLMTTWMVPATIDPALPKISAESQADARTQATPLAWSKQAIKSKSGTETVNEQLGATFLGTTGGCLGETSAIALIIGGIYLLIRKTISIHIPLAVLLSAFVFGLVAYLINPQAYMSPITHLTAGGMLICAFFIATDPVTAPLSTKGMWLFGFGVGALTMLIRIIGEYPEGIMYAVLLMNAVTPLIDKMFKLVPAGGKPNV